MPVSSNLRAISAGFSYIVLAACQPVAEIKTSTPSYDSLADEIGKISVVAVPFDELPGETRAEKLLYQAGIVSQMQTTSLVMFDTQIKTVEMAGNEALAKELTENRQLLMDSMEAELGIFIKDAALIYENYLTPEEIERLIVLHGDPAMQKLIQNQPKLSQDILPPAVAFGERAGIRFEKAVMKKNKGQ